MKKLIWSIFYKENFHKIYLINETLVLNIQWFWYGNWNLIEKLIIIGIKKLLIIENKINKVNKFNQQNCYFFFIFIKSFTQHKLMSHKCTF